MSTSTTVDKAAMNRLLAEYPMLTVNGMSSPGDMHFDAHRTDMFSDGVLAEVVHCMAFLSAFTTVKAAKTSSYSIKHRAEDWGVGETKYIHNGAAIAAGLLLGIPVKFDGLNPLFGISVPEYDWVFYHCRKPYPRSRARKPQGWDEFIAWRETIRY